MKSTPTHNQPKSMHCDWGMMRDETNWDKTDGVAELRGRLDKIREGFEAAVDVSSGPSLGSSRSVSVHRLSRLAREWQKAGEAQSDLASEAAKKEDTIKVLTHLTRSHTLDNCATELRLFIGEHARRADDIATGDTPPVDNDHVAPGCELFSAPNAGDVARAGNAAAPKQPNSL